MDEIHLDPDCDFVACKSSESDGVSSSVALRHFGECKRCRKYHELVVARSGRSKLEVEKEFSRLKEHEERLAREHAENERNSLARMLLLLSYLKCFDGLSLKGEVRTARETPDRAPTESVAVVASEIGSLTLHTYSQREAISVHWPDGAGIVFESVHGVVSALAKRMAEARFRRQFKTKGA